MRATREKGRAMGTEEREARIAEIESTIAGNKLLLAQSDYKALKYAEGEVTAKEYKQTKEARQALRDEINRLEEELAGLLEE